MSKAYSDDLRRRAIAAYEAGHTYEEVAQRFGVSVSFVRTLRKLKNETGGIVHRPHGGGMPRRLSHQDEAALHRWCQIQPDMTLREYQHRLQTERGVEVSIPTLSRIVRELGLTVKKSLSTRRNNGRRKSA